MRKILTFATLITSLLCCCSKTEPKYSIGEKAPVHEHFYATVYSKTVVNVIEYKDKNNEIKVFETNGQETFVQINLVISCDRTTGVTHTFDENDFKLTDGILNYYSVGNVKAHKDYTWVVTEIHTSETKELELYFKVQSSDLDEYRYLEIDFENMAGNSTDIYLEKREKI